MNMLFDPSKLLVDRFLTLVQSNTPPQHEKIVSKWVAAYLKELGEKLGFEFAFDDAGEKVGDDVGNLIAF